MQLKTKNILIDFGKDFYHQLLKYNVPHIDYAFLTHAHQDHMDGAEQFVVMKDLEIKIPRGVLEKFKDRANSQWLLARNPDLKICEFKPFEVDGFTIDSVKLKHQKDYDGDPFPCFGYVFRSRNFSFAYLGDNNEILEPEKLQNLDLLITDGNKIKNNGWGHIGIEDGIKTQYEVLKPKRMIFTHLSHDVEYEKMSEYVKKFGNIELAYDGMEVEF
jgi:phosphoribosyl 1,2-cyclic phosphate phosphodiesterase